MIVRGGRSRIPPCHGRFICAYFALKKTCDIGLGPTVLLATRDGPAANIYYEFFFILYRIFLAVVFIRNYPFEPMEIYFIITDVQPVG